MEKIEFLSAVLLVSKNPKRLADFYRDVLGVPLEDEKHGDSEPHWGCELGDIHFAIHPVENFPDKRAGVGAVKLAFTTFDIRALLQRLKARGVRPIEPITEPSYGLSMSIEDPDGNLVEFTQLADRWFEHLEKRRTKGIDVIERWKQSGKKAAAERA